MSALAEGGQGHSCGDSGLDFFVVVVGQRYWDHVPRVSVKLARRPAWEDGPVEVQCLMICVVSDGS
jgi:hypothetical protein